MADFITPLAQGLMSGLQPGLNLGNIAQQRQEQMRQQQYRNLMGQYLNQPNLGTMQKMRQVDPGAAYELESALQNRQAERQKAQRDYLESGLERQVELFQGVSTPGEYQRMRRMFATTHPDLAARTPREYDPGFVRSMVNQALGPKDRLTMDRKYKTGGYEVTEAYDPATGEYKRIGASPISRGGGSGRSPKERKLSSLLTDIDQVSSEYQSAVRGIDPFTKMIMPKEEAEKSARMARARLKNKLKALKNMASEEELEDALYRAGYSPGSDVYKEAMSEVGQGYGMRSFATSGDQKEAAKRLLLRAQRENPDADEETLKQRAREMLKAGM